ncbi:hypothetical protein EI94DRAFT_1720617 [Lactarius quietus]|nr:hypothetical protein EI94DRAFT_1720617 [Lactarius quietus]
MMAMNMFLQLTLAFGKAQSHYLHSLLKISRSRPKACSILKPGIAPQFVRSRPIVWVHHKRGTLFSTSVIG